MLSPAFKPQTEESSAWSAADALTVTTLFKSAYFKMIYAVSIFVVLAGYNFPNKF